LSGPSGSVPNHLSDLLLVNGLGIDTDLDWTLVPLNRGDRRVVSNRGLGGIGGRINPVRFVVVREFVDIVLDPIEDGKVHANVRIVALVEPSDWRDASLGNNSDVELPIGPGSTPSLLVEIEVLGLVVDTKGRSGVQHGSTEAGSRNGLLREMSTDAPATRPDDLLDGIVHPLVVDADLGLVGPASSGEVGDRGDVRRGKGSTVGPAVTVNVFPDSVLVIDVVDANLWRVGRLGIPDDRGDGCALFCLEQPHGLAWCSPAPGFIVGGLVDPAVGVLEVDTDVLAIVRPVNGRDTCGDDCRHIESC